MKTLKEQLANMNFAEAEKTADTILKMMGLTIRSRRSRLIRPANANNPKPCRRNQAKHAADPFAAFFPHQLVFLASDRIALKSAQRDALLARIKTARRGWRNSQTAAGTRSRRTRGSDFAGTRG